MLNSGEPLRIIVETVPHEVVSRLEREDKQLRNEINGLRGMLSQAMDVIGDLKREIRSLKSN